MRVALGALALLGLASMAQAAITTFATFSENVGAPDFVFTNNGGTSGTYTASSPIDFRYLNIVGLPADLQGIQSATITISATTTSPGTVSGGSVSQPFPVVATDITITRNSAAAEGSGSRTILLQVTNTGSITGLNGSTSGNFNAATSTGQTVTFTSDFLNFSNTVARDLAIAMTQINPALGLGAGNFLSDFTAVASGNFSSDPVPVVTSPLIAKHFSPNPIVPGGTSTLTFTLTNNGAAPITNATFSDTYPAGLVNAATPNIVNTCGGSVSGGAAAGNTIGLSGVTIGANSSCTIAVNVTAPASGCYANTSATIGSDQGSGNSASDTLCVGLPPTVTKVFSANPILPGGTSTLTVTISNPNTTAIHGVKFTDTYPAGLVNRNPTGLTNTCGGTGSAAANGSTLSLGGTGGTIAASSSCQVTVNVTAAGSGSYVNSTGTITTTDSGNGGPGTDTLVVGFSSVKAFSPNPIVPGATSVMTITLNNPTGSAITGVNFLDTYPANLVNTGTPSPATTCGGSPTAAANGNTASLSGGTIPANGSCTVTVNVTSAVAATYVNSTGSIHSDQGDGAGATGSLVVLGPLTAGKTFLQNPINLNGTSVLQITLTNPNPAAVSSAAFTDTYPANLFNTGTPNPATTCSGGIATAAPNGSSLSLSGGTVPANGSCTIAVNVTSAIAATYVNHTGSITSSAGTTGDVTGSLVVLQPPTVAKSFTPSSIAGNGTSLLQIAITNPNASAITGVSFTDSYPANLFNIGTPNGTATNCGGGALVTALPNDTSVSLGVGAIAAGATCTVTVDVTSSVAGTYLNHSGTVNSSSGTGADATASLTVLAPFSVAKSFNPTSIAASGTSLMTITFTNPNATPVTGIAMTDNYPVNLFNTAAPGTTNACGGSVVAAANGGSLSLSGGTIPANGSCAITLNVTSAFAGAYVNSTDVVTSTNAGSAGPASASLVVNNNAPSVSKAFAASPVLTNTPTQMTITLINPNASAVTGVSFTDNYPSGLVNSGAPAAATTCGGSVNAAANGNSVALSGGSIPGSGSCTVTVNVLSASAGSYVNSTGTVTAGNAPSFGPASATLIVLAPPTASKAFSPATIAVNGTSQVTITLNNSNAVAVTGVAFTDTYPAGLVNTAAPGAATTCGGTATATANGNTLALSGATIPANGSCTVTANVTSATGGVYVNNTGNITTSGGTLPGVTGTLTVISPLTVAKSFAPGTIAAAGTSVMTITLTNPNTSTVVTGVAFTDNYPASLVNTAVPGTTNSCGGAVAALANGASLALAGGSLPASGSCTITVNVTSATPGTYANSTGVVSTTNAGNAGPATGTLIVQSLTPPTATKVFAPGTILVGGTSQITITLNNGNAVPVTGVAFTDTYPAGLSNTAAPGAATTCSGTASAVANGNTLSLSGATIPASGSCTVTVNVTSAAGGIYVNNTGNITTSTATVPGVTGSLTVISPLAVAKSFAPATIASNGSSVMTITLTNPNTTTVLTGVAFTDNYPANVTNTATPGATNTCGGTVTTAPNGTSLSLATGSIAASGSCIITVNVTSAVPGTYVNSTGVITTTNAGNAGPATGTLIVSNTAVSVSKSFAPTMIAMGGTSLLTITLTNPNVAAVTGVAFTDNYPVNVSNTATPGTTNTCGGTVTAANNGTSVALSGGTISASGSCTITLNVTSNVAGSYVNSTGTVTTSNAGNAGPATATLLVLSPPNATKVFAPATINAGQTSLLTITLTNPNATTAITGLAFTDTYPANLQNSATPAVATTCGGTATAAANGPSVALIGGTLAGGASCAVTVSVTSNTSGTYVNSTGAVTTTNAGNGSPGTGTLTVNNTPFTVAKSFAPATINTGASSVLTITLSNSNPAPVAGVAFTDSYPPNLGNTGTPAAASTCGGTVTAVANGGSVALTGGTVPANGICTVTVNVTSAVAGTYVNSTGPVTSTNAGTAAPATATLLVNAQPFAVSKAFAGGSIAPGGAVLLTITLTNPNPGPVMSASFTDTYPVGLVNTATPNLANTCGGTAVGAANGTSLSLTGGTVPANASCSVTVTVTAFTSGTYVNTTGLVTSGNSGNAGPVGATLVVGVSLPLQIPTLSQWMLVLLAPLLFLGALLVRRKC